MRKLSLLVVLLLLGADSVPTTGSVGGTVVSVLGGKAVSRKEVYVYLVPVGRRRGPPPGAGIKHTIVQKGREFVPRVVIVPVGAEVSFPNLDREPHNVYSPTDPVFDLGRYGPSKRGKQHVFEDPDEFDIYCDRHRFMSAKVKVVDTPYIARVVAGKFWFPSVAPGTYKVFAWAPNSPDAAYPQEIKVTAGITVTLDHELHVQIKTPPLCHNRKDGSEYDKNDYGECPKPFE